MTEHRFLRLILYIFLFCVLVLLFFRFLLPVLPSAGCRSGSRSRGRYTRRW